MKTKIKKVLKEFSKISLHTIMIILLVGAILNCFAIAVNGGRMPVYTSDFIYNSSLHFTIQNLSEVNKPWLIDRWQFINQICSVGDLIIFFGATLFVLNIFSKIIILHKNKKRKWKKKQ
jgi:heme/copper-type cytochrome/quinol oxidase subunit 1